MKRASEAFLENSLKSLGEILLGSFPAQTGTRQEDCFLRLNNAAPRAAPALRAPTQASISFSPEWAGPAVQAGLSWVVLLVWVGVPVISGGWWWVANLERSPLDGWGNGAAPGVPLSRRLAQVGSHSKGRVARAEKTPISAFSSLRRCLIGSHPFDNSRSHE